MLTIANLRKSKGNVVSLCFAMVFVAIFIGIGFAMLFGIGDFFDQRANELNTGHIVTHLSEDYVFANTQIRLVKEDARVETIEIQDFVIGNGYAVLNDMPDLGLLMFSAVHQDQQLNPLTLVGDYLPLTGNAIYIPHFMMISGGFELGDIIVFSFLEEEIEFSVAGSIEEILFGSINAFRRRMYVSDEMFNSLQQQFPNEVTEALIARLHDVSQVGAFVNEYLDYLLTMQPTNDSQSIILLTHNFNNARNNHTLIPTILGMILAAFAIVFLVVSLIVIRFRINNSIDEGIVDIGVLKALGHTNRQIIASIIMQFGFIALVGGAIGLALSQLALPSVVSLMGPMFSFEWRPDINIPAKLVMLAFILLCVITFALLSTRRIHKLYPLVALRGGINNRKLKKNALPLDIFGGSLAFLLATKDILQNKRQAIAIGIIILAISYTATIGLGTNYVVNVNNEAFLRTMVGEPFDLAVAVRDINDAEGVMERLHDNLQVDRTTGFMRVRYSLDGNMIFADIVEDYSQLQGSTLVSGRFPEQYNEIALSTMIMREIDKGIGDIVVIRIGGEEFEFLVTGHTQTIDGMVVNITGDGAQRMHEFEFSGFFVFLQDGVCPFTFAEALQETEGNIFAELMIFDEVAESFIASMGGLFAAVAVLLSCVASVIVIATMYLVIKTAILRKRRELGIQKALGFTTLQLMNQVALNLTPAIIIGSVVGAVMAYNTFDQFFVLVTGVAGDMSVSIPISLGMTVAAGVGIVVLAYAVSMAVAWRIRRISAYALVSE